MGKRIRYVLIGLVVVAIIAVAARYLHNANLQVLNPAGPIAARERHLMIVATLLMLIVVVPVYVLTFAFAWRYRATNTKAKYSPNLDHNRTAETIWWVVPSALILVLGTIAWNSAHQLDPYKPIASKTPALNVQVVALDWKWLFIYPAQHVATVNYLALPVGTPVHFEITSNAPMNSFWIPQLGGQIYAMPGMSTQLYLMASQTGSFHGSSANISGSGFSQMDFTAHADTTADFNNWVWNSQQAPSQLTLAAYQKLARPSSNVAPRTYWLADPNLYNDTIMKFMMPASEMGQMAGTDKP